MIKVLLCMYVIDHDISCAAVFNALQLLWLDCDSWVVVVSAGCVTDVWKGVR
jgi:hypothetical protein